MYGRCVKCFKIYRHYLFQFFCLRTPDLQRIEGPSGAMVTVPSPGVFLRAVLRFPDRELIERIGSSTKSDDDLERGYKILRDLNVSVFLGLSKKTATKWGLPTGLIQLLLSCHLFSVALRIFLKLPEFWNSFRLINRTRRSSPSRLSNKRRFIFLSIATLHWASREDHPRFEVR